MHTSHHLLLRKHFLPPSPPSPPSSLTPREDWPTLSGSYSPPKWTILRDLACGEPFSSYSSLSSPSDTRCDRVWEGKHSAYRCETCGISESSCMCAECFDPLDHPGHLVRFYTSQTGGCCDCGDGLAWEPKGFCKRHALRGNEERGMSKPTKGMVMACEVVVGYLMWELRKLFFFGVDRMIFEVATEVGLCVTWMERFANLSAVTRDAVCAALEKPRIGLVEFIENDLIWFLNVSREPVLDKSAMRALMRLGCYLPPIVCSELSTLFLRLLLNVDFKEAFTNDFVNGIFKSHLDCLWDIHIDGAKIPKASTWSVTDAGGGINVVLEQEFEEEDVAINDVAAPRSPSVATRVNEMPTSPLLIFGSSTYPHSSRASSIWSTAVPLQNFVPSLPTKKTRIMAKDNTKTILDRVFCQLFHSESIIMVRLDATIRPVLCKLVELFCTEINHEEIFNVNLLGSERFQLASLQIMHHATSLLDNPLVVKAIFEIDEYWDMVIRVVRALQMMHRQRKRTQNEQHVEFIGNSFRAAFSIAFDLHLLVFESIINQGSENVSVECVQNRLDSVTNILREWTMLHWDEIAVRGSIYSFHVGLNRVWAILMLVYARKVGTLYRPPILSDEYLVALARPCVRVFTLFFEITRQEWVRNSNAMQMQAHWYIKILSFGAMELDFACIQLLGYFLGGFAALELLQSEMNEDDALRLLGCLAFDRESSGNTITENRRRRAIHVLASSKEYTFSELGLHVQGTLDERDEILKEIATVHAASNGPGGESATYVLKPNVWGQVEFCGFYLRMYSMEEENAALQFAEQKLYEYPPMQFKTPGGGFERLLEQLLFDTRVTHFLIQALRGKVEGFSESSQERALCLLLAQTEYAARLGPAAASVKFRFSDMDRDTLLDMCKSPRLKEEFNQISKLRLDRLVVLLNKSSLPSSSSLDVTDANVAASSASADASKGDAMAARQRKILKVFQKRQKKFAVTNATESATKHVDESESFSAEASPAITPLSSPEVAASAFSKLDEESHDCLHCGVETNEELSFFVLRAPSNLEFVLESLAFDGQGTWTALLEQNIELDPLPLAYRESKSLLSCTTLLRNRFSAGMFEADDDVLGESNTSVSSSMTKPILHTCGHAIHASCLASYRASVQRSHDLRERYSGQGVIDLSLGEVCCPGCRRVANDLVPLVRVSTRPLILTHTDDERDDRTWLKARLEEFNLNDEFKIDAPENAFRNVQNALSFFRRFPSKENSAFFSERDPAALLAHQLLVLEKDQSVTTVRAVIAPLMSLAVQQVHHDGEDVAPSTDVWARFVNDRFGDRPRRRRSTLITSDLVLVLIEWLILCPSLRFATREKLRVEIVRVFNFLAPFAALQDVFLDASFDFSKRCAHVDRDALERSTGSKPNALRAVALRHASKALKEMVPRHRLLERERVALETDLNQILMVLEISAEESIDVVQPLRSILMQVQERQIPLDAVPFHPYANASNRTSFLESFINRISLLFVALDGDVSMLLFKGLITAQTALAVVDKTYLKSTLSAFFRDVLELTGGADRPVGAGVTSLRLMTTALYPSFRAMKAQCLIALPKDYVTLSANFLARQAICQVCRTSPEHPALCLLCGNLVCFLSSCCRMSSNEDELVHHGARCCRGQGKGTGVFLMLKLSIVVVFLGNKRICRWGSPYLDAHNEEDTRLSRGVPLSLARERVEILEQAQAAQTWLADTRALRLMNGI